MQLCLCCLSASLALLSLPTVPSQTHGQPASSGFCTHRPWPHPKLSLQKLHLKPLAGLSSSQRNAVRPLQGRLRCPASGPDRRLRTLSTHVSKLQSTPACPEPASAPSLDPIGPRGQPVPVASGRLAPGLSPHTDPAHNRGAGCQLLSITPVVPHRDRGRAGTVQQARMTTSCGGSARREEVAEACSPWCPRS